jgi:methylated-DNA-[protein]-cysteine S-methyltransferase
MLDTMKSPRRVTNHGYIESPIGHILVFVTDETVSGVYVADHERAPSPPVDSIEGGSLVDRAITQIREYFDGSRTEFDLPLHLDGTDFQRSVWRALCDIPFGATASYLDIAKQIGHPDAVRAVGTANGSNPVSIIVPCHRVIGSNGSLTGYGWGTDRKSWLLDHERTPRLL